MTRERLEEIMREVWGGENEVGQNEAADLILAELAKEQSVGKTDILAEVRKEVVLWEGVVKTAYRESEKPFVIAWGIDFDGKRGRLVFIEDRNEKEGK